MIPIGRRDGFSVEYVELLERLLVSLRDCDLPRTCHSADCRLTEADRRAVFELVTGWWPQAREHEATAPVLTVLAHLVPEAGVRTWFRDTAERETGDLRKALLEYASMQRTEYEV